MCVLVTKIELKINDDPTVFNGVVSLCVNMDTDPEAVTQFEVIDYIPPKIKGKFGSLVKFIDRLTTDMREVCVRVQEKYYDNFFSTLSSYVKYKGYKVNHLVIKDSNKLKYAEAWKILYSIDYKTLFRVQLIVEDMPEMPAKLLTTINIASPKVWVTTILDPKNPRKLDPKFVTKSDEMVVYINNEEDCEYTDTYLTLQKYLMCPVLLVPRNDRIKFKVKELAKVHNVRYFKSA